MENHLAPLSIDDPFADANGPADGRHPVGPPWLRYAIGEDPDEIRRTQLQEAVLAAGRIPRWTSLPGRELWREWVARFDGAPELALDTAILAAERMVRERCAASQHRLYEIKRRLAGFHARGLLDERYERRGIEGVWNTKPWEMFDEDAHLLLPLPWKGLIAILKHVVVKRRGVRPSDL